MFIISIIATILSFTGNLGVNNKKLWGFYVWIVSNILWVIIALNTPNYPQVIMFVGYSMLNVHGIIKWSKERSKNE
jgi:nicotinamide riboside transporter PnuC